MARLKNVVLGLLSRVLGTQRVAKRILQHLVLQVRNLALLVAVCGAFDRRAECAVILVARANRNVIKATVRDSSHTDFVNRVVCSGAYWAASSRLDILIHICLALVSSSALGASGVVLILETGVRLDALFTADCCTSASTIAPLMIPGLLQLLALLKVA